MSAGKISPGGVRFFNRSRVPGSVEGEFGMCKNVERTATDKRYLGWERDAGGSVEQLGQNLESAA